MSILTEELGRDTSGPWIDTIYELSCREFNQKFALPAGVDVSKLGTSVTAAGSLVISAPQLQDSSLAAAAEGFDIAEKGDVDIKSSSEAKKTTSEGAFEVEGGSGMTKSMSDSQKKEQQKVTRRETEDGWEEEIVEEYEESFSSSSSTTVVTSTQPGMQGQEIKVLSTFNYFSEHL